MKDKYKNWKYLTQKRPNLLIRDWPGVEALEFTLGSYRKLPEVLPAEIEDAATSISLDLFGLRIDQTRYRFPDDYHLLRSDSDRKWNIERHADENESRYGVTDMSDEDTVDFLLRYKLDFRDKFGRPLNCVPLLKRQAEAAARGYMGRMPSPEIISDKQWEESLANAAKEFQKSRKVS